jgi:transposase InsO family protein
MLVAEYFIGQNLYPTRTILNHCGVARSVFYYKSKPIELQCVKGIKPSEYTLIKDGTKVSNEKVKEEIKALLGEEFVDYGYLKVCYYLQEELQYVINHKKVYRLMREADLLNKPTAKHKNKKQWVTELVPKPVSSFEYWEFDIKFIYIHHLGKYAPMLSIIDVYSRYLIAWTMEWSIKKEDVKAFFALIFQDYNLPSKVIVRCDNGSQFESTLVREYLEEMGITQEFTKPATPEQNAHIESYHSIIARAVCRRFDFENLQHAKEVFNRWEVFYNQKRIHSGIEYKSPEKYLKSKNLSVPKSKK